MCSHSFVDSHLAHSLIIWVLGKIFSPPFFSSASTSAGGAHQNFPQTYKSESARKLIFTQLFLQQKQADRHLT